MFLALALSLLLHCTHPGEDAAIHLEIPEALLLIAFFAFATLTLPCSPLPAPARSVLYSENPDTRWISSKLIIFKVFHVALPTLPSLDFNSHPPIGIDRCTWQSSRYARSRFSTVPCFSIPLSGMPLLSPRFFSLPLCLLKFYLPSRPVWQTCSWLAPWEWSRSNLLPLQYLESASSDA